MRIPLPKMMRHWREQEFEKRLIPPRARKLLKLWAFVVAQLPSFYHAGARVAAFWLYRRGKKLKGRMTRVPYGEGWTRFRDFPAPLGKTLQSQWRGARKHKRP
jgi:L-lactate dehydrogenase complex protein LldF